MTEDEWLACEHPMRMFSALNDGTEAWRHRHWPSRRKQKLFAVAACRSVPGLMTGERHAEVVLEVERLLDLKQVPECTALRLANKVWHVIPGSSETHVGWLPFRTAYEKDESDMAWVQNFMANWNEGASNDPNPAACSLLREVMGYPLGHVVLHPHQRTPQAVSLAQAAYDDRRGDGTLDPFLLSLTADALEEAGCDSEDLLQHLRGKRRCTACLREQGRHADACACKAYGGWFPMDWPPACGPHYRGCWAVDRVLGKT
jgi:hypothetical protein